MRYPVLRWMIHMQFRTRNCIRAYSKQSPYALQYRHAHIQCRLTVIKFVPFDRHSAIRYYQSRHRYDVRPNVLTSRAEMPSPHILIQYRYPVPHPIGFAKVKFCWLNWEPVRNLRSDVHGAHGMAETPNRRTNLILISPVNIGGRSRNGGRMDLGYCNQKRMV